jgi:hypothetical protein
LKFRVRSAFKLARMVALCLQLLSQET